MSTGEIRRTLLCRALLSGAGLLVLSDPFAGLDATSRAILLEFFDSIVRRQLDSSSEDSGFPRIILSMERFHEIPSAINRVIEFSNKKISFEGSREEYENVLAQRQAASEKEREVHMEKKLFHYEVRLSKTESRMLHNNAHLAGMPCSEYLRTLIKGFVPKQMPNKDFHDVLQRLNKICLELSEEQNPKLVREIRKTVKQLQELYLNMDSVCTIQFEKGGDAE